MKFLSVVIVVLMIFSGCSNQQSVGNDLYMQATEEQSLSGTEETTKVEVTDSTRESSDIKNSVDEETNYELTTYGTDYLEDGIVIVLAVYNEANEISWIESWNGVQVATQATFSSITINEDRIYIVVSGILFALDKVSGETLWKVSDIGSSFERPTVDKDGNIFIVGQYSPYISAITSDGELLWQEINDELDGAYTIELIDDLLLVKCLGGEFKYDKYGKRAE